MDCRKRIILLLSVLVTIFLSWCNQVSEAIVAFGHVVGMTGGSETALAREAGLHFSAVAFSINYGAGLKYSILKVEKTGLEKTLPELIQLFIETLRAPFEQNCNCDQAIHYSENPKIDLFA